MTLIDMRMAEAGCDDTVLEQHARTFPAAVLFTDRFDGELTTYALVPRPDYAITLEGDDDGAPYVVYYADAATTAFFPASDFYIDSEVVFALRDPL